jgi:hypothetical protein
MLTNTCLTQDAGRNDENLARSFKGVEKTIGIVEIILTDTISTIL